MMIPNQNYLKYFPDEDIPEINERTKRSSCLRIFNYSIAYDTTNKEPLFYEEYSGSINDISQLEFMLEKAAGYGYKKVGFILDRGYFSQGNIKCLDSHGYSFIIMVKGMSALVDSLILERKGTFETNGHSILMNLMFMEQR